VRVALCLDPNDTASSSIVAKAMRSMQPESAKSDPDRVAHVKLTNRIGSERIDGPLIPAEGLYPNLGERWTRPAGSGIALSIPARLFQRITEKIVRGITHLKTGQFIEPPYKFDFYATNEDDSTPIQDFITQYGKEHAQEPGIVVRRAAMPNRGISAIYMIQFWKQFKTYAAVLPVELRHA
jgi:hypothetical protein